MQHYLRIVNSRYKHYTRRLTNSIGRKVEYIVGQTPDAIERLTIKGPVIVKPVDESGSCAVTLCHSKKDIVAAVRKVVSLPPKASHYSRSGMYLLEEYISGKEFSAEMIWDNTVSEWINLGFTKKIVGHKPNFVELGHIFPHSFGEEEDATITNIIKRWLTVVGLDYGVAHVEFRVHYDIPVLMEINPRLGGDMIPELIYLATGMDIFSRLLALHVAPRHIPELVPVVRVGCVAGISFLTPPRSGRIVKMEPPDRQDVAIVRFHFQQSVEARGVATSSDDRVGFVIAVGTNEKHVRSILNTFCRDVRFCYQR